MNNSSASKEEDVGEKEEQTEDSKLGEKERDDRKAEEEEEEEEESLQFRRNTSSTSAPHFLEIKQETIFQEQESPTQNLLNDASIMENEGPLSTDSLESPPEQQTTSQSVSIQATIG